MDTGQRGGYSEELALDGSQLSNGLAVEEACWAADHHRHPVPTLTPVLQDALLQLELDWTLSLLRTLRLLTDEILGLWTEIAEQNFLSRLLLCVLFYSLGLFRFDTVRQIESKVGLFS